jgi:hypothetical protein
MRKFLAACGAGAAFLGFLGTATVYLSGGTMQEALPSIGAMAIGAIIVFAVGASLRGGGR